MNQDQSREFLIKHSRSSKNGLFPQSYNLEAKLTNPMCGDHVELRIRSVNDEIKEMGFKANACAICSASSSILSEISIGMKVQEVLNLVGLFEKSVMDKADLPWPDELSALSCFEHLRVNPARRMCALLPYITFKRSLKNET